MVRLLPCLSGTCPPGSSTQRARHLSWKGRRTAFFSSAFDADTGELLDTLRQQHEGEDEEVEDVGGGDGDPFLQLRLALDAELAALERDHVGRRGRRPTSRRVLLL